MGLRGLGFRLGFGGLGCFNSILDLLTWQGLDLDLKWFRAWGQPFELRPILRSAFRHHRSASAIESVVQ